VARLAAYFDPNDRRYFITRQSVDTGIARDTSVREGWHLWILGRVDI
jgi:hypothetical protein